MRQIRNMFSIQFHSCEHHGEWFLTAYQFVRSESDCHSAANGEYQTSVVGQARRPVHHRYGRYAVINSQVDNCWRDA